MKKTFLLIALAALTFVGKGQITLEQTYTNIFSPTGDFGLLNLGGTSYKYYFVDKSNSEFTLYNLDHSIFKIVSIPETWSNNNYVIQYITNSLFDCDSSNVEYVLVHYNPNYVKIYREDSTTVFFSDSAQGQTWMGTANIINYYVKNTPVGSKMILRYPDGKVNVYSLCDSLPSGFLTSPDGSNSDLSYPIPNPSSNSTHVEYKLPNGTRNGEMVFYNVNGTEVKRYKVDNTFDSLQLNNSDLPSGTYLYHLLTPNGVSSPKKMVVIK